MKKDILVGTQKHQVTVMYKTLYILIMCCFFLASCKEEKVIVPKQTQPSEKKPEIIQPVIIPLEEITGKFEPSDHEDFVLIEKKYADRGGMYLQKEAYEAFIKMHRAASKEGVDLIIRSATRNFYRQKEIWEGKWTGQRLAEGGENLRSSTPDHTERALKILRWSSMPGSSRHHWGTDIDLNSFDNAYFETGNGQKLYAWLTAHADAFGFCQPYSPKNEGRPNGYNEEKWHWSYMPLAENYYFSAQQNLKNEDLNGFLGSETAASIDVKQKYVLGVSHQCRATSQTE